MIRIIDYKAGNGPSVLHAVTHLGYDACFARCPKDLEDATHVLLPGVGSAKATMDSLREMNMIQPMESVVLHKQIPFLGICVGMQILFEHSQEGDAQCLGWLSGEVARYDGAKTRVPQMGWNQVRFVKNTACDAKDDYFYFVNSYYARPKDPHDLWGETDYNGPFAAAVCRNNIYGTQFHVEKSGKAGLSLLTNFLNL